MSLTVLVIVVVAGIGAIVAAVHFTGGTTIARLDSAGAARARFAEDFGDARVREIWLANDGETAFLELDGGRVGVVQSFGDRFLTRIVGARDISTAKRLDDRTMRLDFRDFTWRGGDFRFDDAAPADRVRALLGGGTTEGD